MYVSLVFNIMYSQGVFFIWAPLKSRKTGFTENMKPLYKLFVTLIKIKLGAMINFLSVDSKLRGLCPQKNVVNDNLDCDVILTASEK